jgi:hypothetical protein
LSTCFKNQQRRSTKVFAIVAADLKAIKLEDFDSNLGLGAILQHCFCAVNRGVGAGAELG